MSLAQIKEERGKKKRGEGEGERGRARDFTFSCMPALAVVGGEKGGGVRVVVGRGEGKRGREGGALETSSAIVRWEVGGGGFNAGSGAPPPPPFSQVQHELQRKRERKNGRCLPSPLSILALFQM